jgi:hypothetical protein
MIAPDMVAAIHFPTYCLPTPLAMDLFIVFDDA